MADFGAVRVAQAAASPEQTRRMPGGVSAEVAVGSVYLSTDEGATTATAM